MLTPVTFSQIVDVTTPCPVTRYDTTQWYDIKRYLLERVSQPDVGHRKIPRAVCALCDDNHELDIVGVPRSSETAIRFEGVALPCGHMFCMPCFNEYTEALPDPSPYDNDVNPLCGRRRLTREYRCPICRADMHHKKCWCEVGACQLPKSELLDKKRVRWQPEILHPGDINELENETQAIEAVGLFDTVEDDGTTSTYMDPTTRTAIRRYVKAVDVTVSEVEEQLAACENGEQKEEDEEEEEEDDDEDSEDNGDWDIALPYESSDDSSEDGEGGVADGDNHNNHEAPPGEDHQHQDGNDAPEEDHQGRGNNCHSQHGDTNHSCFHTFHECFATTIYEDNLVISQWEEEWEFQDYFDPTGNFDHTTTARHSARRNDKTWPPGLWNAAVPPVCRACDEDRVDDLVHHLEVARCKNVVVPKWLDKLPNTWPVVPSNVVCEL